MFRYISKRILIMIPTVMGIVLLAMLLLTLVPGPGIRGLSSYSSHGDFLDSILETLHLHSTFFGRYIRFFSNILNGDFGNIRQTGFNMSVELSARIAHTLLITLCGIVISFILGVPLGFISALHQGKPADNGIAIGTLLLSSVPSYCLAVLLTVIFVVWLRLLPLTGYKTALNYVLPSVVSSAPGIAMVTSIMRSAVLRIMKSPFVTALQASGMKKARILCLHVFKNTLVTFMGSFQSIAIQILCGSMIAENFFSIPGLGVMLVGAVNNRSAYLCMVCIVIYSFLILAISFIADMLCLIVDPQFRSRVIGGKAR